MSTSFTQDSPTEPTSPECEEDNKPDAAADIAKEWDSDTESETSNSSSGEFIWKVIIFTPDRGVVYIGAFIMSPVYWML